MVLSSVSSEGTGSDMCCDEVVHVRVQTSEASLTCAPRASARRRAAFFRRPPVCLGSTSKVNTSVDADAHTRREHEAGYSHVMVMPEDPGYRYGRPYRGHCALANAYSGKATSPLQLPLWHVRPVWTGLHRLRVQWMRWRQAGGAKSCYGHGDEHARRQPFRRGQV